MMGTDRIWTLLGMSCLYQEAYGSVPVPSVSVVEYVCGNSIVRKYGVSENQLLCNHFFWFNSVY